MAIVVAVREELDQNLVLLSGSFGLTSADIDAEWLRLDATNDPLTGDLTTQALVPDVTDIRDVGTDLQRFGDLFSTSANAVRTSGAGPVSILNTDSAGDRSNIFGKVFNTNTNGAGLATLASTGVASFANGYARQGDGAAGTAAEAVVEATGNGSTALGNSFSNGPAAEGRLSSTSLGAAALGYAAGINASSVIQATALGAFAQGFSLGLGSDTIIEATANGAFAQGSQVVFSGTLSAIGARGLGSFAQGNSGTDGNIRADAPGQFVQGYCSNGTLGQSTNTGSGSFSQGLVTTGTLAANGPGCFAQGSASSGGTILAGNGTSSVKGAFAQGSAGAGQLIQAAASNAAQFGPGTNTLADSLQVGGAGLRFKGTAGAPGTLQNGDIWVAGGFVYIRSNGVSVQI